MNRTNHPRTRVSNKTFDGHSPLIGMTQQLFERNGLFDWDNARVSSLAKRLNMSVHVLVAIAGGFTYKDYKTNKNGRRTVIFHYDMVTNCWNDNAWPAYLTVQFDHWERVLNEQPAFHVQDLIMTKIITDKTYGRSGDSGSDGVNPGKVERDLHRDLPIGNAEGEDDGGGMLQM